MFENVYNNKTRILGAYKKLKSYYYYIRYCIMTHRYNSDTAKPNYYKIKDCKMKMEVLNNCVLLSSNTRLNKFHCN